MNRYLIFTVLAISLSAGLVTAQPPGRGGPQGMREGGGPPTEMIVQLFTQADTNGDGSVTKAELTAAMQNHGAGNQRGPGGPPPGRGEGGDERQGPPAGEHGQHGGQHGAPPQPGQVLPEPIAQSLGLNEKQTRLLAALQADVDKRLAAILTDGQREQLKNARPPHGPDHGAGGEAGNRGQDRPQRPN